MKGISWLLECLIIGLSLRVFCSLQRQKWVAPSSLKVLKRPENQCASSAPTITKCHISVYLFPSLPKNKLKRISFVSDTIRVRFKLSNFNHRFFSTKNQRQRNFTSNDTLKKFRESWTKMTLKRPDILITHEMLKILCNIVGCGSKIRQKEKKTLGLEPSWMNVGIKIEKKWKVRFSRAMP